MDPVLRVLLVDDNPDDRLLIQRELIKEFPLLEIQHAGSQRIFMETIRNIPVDLVITDYDLGWSNGLDIFHSVRNIHPHCPVIMFTGTGNEEIAVMAMKAGLDDYVLKSVRHLKRLGIAVRSVLDKAEQKKAITELENRYRNLFERIPIGLYRSDSDGRMLDVNQTMIDMLRYPDKETLLKVNTSELYVDKSDRIRWQDLMRKNRKVREFICRFRCYDGQTIWGEENSVIIQQGDHTLIQYEGSLVDVSLRKSAEDALIESEANYRSIFNASNDVIIVHDLTGDHIFDVNEKVVDFFEFTLEEVREMRVRELYADASVQSGSELEDYFRKAAEGTPVFFEWIAQGKSLRKFWVEAGLKRTNIGGMDRILHIIRNIDDRKRAQEEQEYTQLQLIQAQKTESIANLVHGLTHEFNNYLTAIQGYAELALSDVSETDEVQRLLDSILHATFKTASLVRQMLIFSVNQHPGMAEINPNVVIQDLFKILNSSLQPNIVLQSDLDPEIWNIMANRTNIEQMLMNLVTNSCDAMAAGGNLTVVTKNVLLTSDHPRSQNQLKTGQYIQISVADSGPGIPEEILRHIFLPFFSTKDPQRGSGLGLSVVDSIVKQANGWIEVDTKVGSGSIFSVYFPAIEVASETGKLRIMSSSGLRQTVLIAERDDELRSFLQHALEHMNYRVLISHNSKEAREIFYQNKDRCTILLCDLELEDESGMRLAEDLSKINPHLRVVLISEYFSDSMKIQQGTNFNFRTVRKPFKLTDLLETLKSG